MGRKTVARIVAVAATMLLAMNSASASTGRYAAGDPLADGDWAEGLTPGRFEARRSIAPPGTIPLARLDCMDAGVGGSCPSLQKCLTSCVVVFDLDMAFCAAVGMPWIGQCIINASDRWAQCRRDCTGDYDG